MNTQNDSARIEELRAALGGRLTVVGHHYEQEGTIRHCDIRGDSLELARRVPGIASDYSIFGIIDHIDLRGRRVYDKAKEDG